MNDEATSTRAAPLASLKIDSRRPDGPRLAVLRQGLAAYAAQA